MGLSEESFQFANNEDGKHFSEMLSRHPERFIEMCERFLESDENIIGFGNFAKVFTIGTKKPYCVKILRKDVEVQTKSLPVAEEFEYLRKVSTMSGEKIAPEPIFCIKSDSKSENELICMEQVGGPSLKEVFEGDEELPDTFEIYSFFKKLREKIQRLHSTNVYHRDLHSGNIMIDKETGDPIIIDFGLATTALSSSDDEEIYTLGINPSGGVNKAISDESYINSMFKKMKQHLGMS